MTAYIALALQVPSPLGGGQDWLYQITNDITAMTTNNGGVLTNLGLTLLSSISFFMLIGMVVRYSTQTMTFSLNPSPIEGGVIVNFFMRLLVCTLLESFWVNPVPGVGFGLNHVFSYIAQQMVVAFDQSSYATFTQLLKDASNTGQPSALSITENLMYYDVQILMALASAILFVINVSSFIFYAVGALFGPIFIPLLMTDSFRGKFYSFVETLLSFAMIRAVSAAFIFVWAQFINTFLQHTFNGDYSLQQWTANFIAGNMVFVAFIVNMLFIPTVTQAIFGGGAGAAGSGTGLVTRVLSYGLRK